MLRQLIKSREDPHLVYSRIQPSLVGFETVKLVRRGLVGLTSDFAALQRTLMIIGDCIAAWECVRLRRHTVFVAEFASITAVAMFLPLRIVGLLGEVWLNVNHNLNNRLESEVLLPLLAKWFMIAFIEPDDRLVERFTYLKAIRIKHSQRAPGAPAIVYSFVGRRPEQIRHDHVTYLSTLDNVIGGKVRHVVVGGDRPRLTSEELLNMYRDDSIIVVLYAENSYESRHSGLILEAISLGIPVCMPRSPLGEVYRRRGFPVHLFRTPSDLGEIVQGQLRVLGSM